MEPKSFPFANDHMIIRFASAMDMEPVFLGNPWMVIGQLGMEPWILDFALGINAVKTTTIWIHLPQLSIEYWRKEFILDIALVVGKPLDMDEFTVRLQKLGFARMHVQINAMEPLIPGISIM